MRVFLDCGILLLLAALPFYWALVQNASKKSGMIDFWVGVRCQASEVTDGKEYGAFDYIMAFSNVLTLIALNEFNSKRQRSRPRGTDTGFIDLPTAQHVEAWIPAPGSSGCLVYCGSARAGSTPGTPCLGAWGCWPCLSPWASCWVKAEAPPSASPKMLHNYMKNFSYIYVVELLPSTDM